DQDSASDDPILEMFHADSATLVIARAERNAVIEHAIVLKVAQRIEMGDEGAVIPDGPGVDARNFTHFELERIRVVGRLLRRQRVRYGNRDSVFDETGGL